MMEYRAYSIVNMYMKGIQAGIQAAHSQSELLLKMQNELTDAHIKMINQWRAHPVMILKNGGDHESMVQTLRMLCGQSQFPFASFHETGLGPNVLTSITVILPDVKAVVGGDQDDFFYRYTQNERDLFYRVNLMRSAS